MIPYAIGIDIVEVERFKVWITFSDTQLLRIFSNEEIRYCRTSSLQKTAERFAVRFAAREAFYKALTPWAHHQLIPFLTLCRLIRITHRKNAPFLSVDWDQLHEWYTLPPKPTALVSLSHTSSTAIAQIIITHNNPEPTQGSPYPD